MNSRVYVAATVTMAVGLGVSNIVLQERLLRSQKTVEKYKVWYTAALNQLSPVQMLKVMDEVQLEGSQNLQGL